MKLKKRTFVRVVTFLSAAVVCLGVFAATEAVRISEYRQADSDINRQAFYDLSEALQNLDYAMQKAEYASTPYSRVVLTADIQREAGAAQTALERLPVSGLMLNNISKLFSQVSDYSFTLAKKSVYGLEITEAEKETLRTFRTRAATLAETLEKMELTFEDMKTEQATADSALNPKDGETSVLKETDDALINRVYLTYDGQYSDNLFDGSSEYIASLDKMTQEEVLPVAAVYLDAGSDTVTCLGITNSGDMSAYIFTSGDRGVCVSVRGAKLLSYWNEAEQSRGDALSLEELTDTVSERLLRYGFSDAEAVFYRTANGIVQMSLVPIENGVYLYPEQITAAVNESTGELIGLDATSYWAYYKEMRVYPFTDEAETASSPEGNTSVRRVVLQTDGGNELCCYEYKIPAKSGNILLYVNAENGNEEKILLLIENDSGSYTK